MNSKVVVAERKFYLEDDPNKIISLKIIAPTKDNPDFRIEMDGVDPQVFPCMFGGADSLQAFMQTSLLLKYRVDDINNSVFQGKLRWEGDSEGGLGIYSMVKVGEQK